jgi:uncharacterized protein (DUF486 family)
MPFVSPYLTPIPLLTGSNVFMTAAWYWHLRYKEVLLFKVILISWGLALIEYCLAVPANRYGNAVYNAGPAQDDAGGHHLCGVCRLLIFLFARTDHAESGFWLRADRDGRVFRVSQVVRTGDFSRRTYSAKRGAQFSSGRL